MKKRIVSLVLALSLCTSLLVVPAYADSVISWDTFVKILDTLTIESGMQEFDIGKLGGYVVPSESVWNGNHTTVTYDILENAVFQLQYENPQISFSISPISLYRPTSSTSSEESGYFGVRVIIPYTYAVYWLTNGNGKALVARPASSDITSINAIPRAQAAAAGAYRMLSYEDLYNLAYDYNAQHNYKLALNTDGVYWAISSRGDYVLANESGLPYGAVGPSAVNGNGNSRPTTNTDVIGDTIIDWLNQSVSNAQGDTINYDNCTYDSSTKTYYIDAHQETTNNYYNYSYTYNINNTTITYIGSSAEYTEQYECYYTLPDGRSSADLTKEELEQLNLNIDVVPYDRTTEDTSLWSLYHFDGNTRDSSYWNYRSRFKWNTGASITYLDAGNFNGCLYLDEKTHDFELEMPSMLGSHYVALEFRYYQSATETPVNDSYVNLGGETLLRFDGNSLMTGSNTVLADMPVGSWVSIALCRNTLGKLYYYMNGVCVGSASDSTNFNNKITFHFGNEQQTYKYLDEIRVLQSRGSKTYLNRGANYTPAVVPFDTNLSLVLPDTGSYIDTRYPHNENLLTNWYFGNPVNQRDFVSGNDPGWGEFIDLWIGSHQPVIIGDNYVSTSLFRQALPSFSSLIGETVTASVLTEFGLSSVTGVVSSSSAINSSDSLVGFGTYAGYGWNELSFKIQCSGNVYAAKLELGTEQTLAHQEGDKWVLNEIPSYREQLEKCREYYVSDGDMVADEWVSVEYSGVNLVDGDLRVSAPPVDNLSYSSYYFNDACTSQFAKGSDISITSADGLCRIQNNGSSFTPSISATSANALFIPFGDVYGHHGNIRSSYSTGNYTMTVVFSDGTSSSVTSTLSTFDSRYSSGFILEDLLRMTDQSLSFDWGKMGVSNCLYPTKHRYSYGAGPLDSWQVGFYIAPDAGKSVDIAYIVLEKSATSSVSASLNSAIVNVDMDAFTPTLAVRTDIGITKKQFGGVRPILPGRGDVYAMVENGFITSLQQYDGQAWVQVDGRIWTGQRWVPYSSYNVITLSDMYDIADASGQGGYEYIYTEQGFWSWLQKWLMQFKTDLFEKLNGLGSGTSPGSCAHTYTSEVISVPSCTDPGETLYTCSKCGDQYTEYQDALDHDYHLTEEVQNTYSLPSGILCPSCGSDAFSYLLDEDECEYSCSCSDCDHVWSTRAEIEYGHSTYTCSRCGDEYIESNKVKRNLFDAIGDLLSDTFTWVTDKLSQLIDSLSGLMDAFNDRIDGIIESVGNYPLLFGAFLVGMPEDLMNIIWFGLIAGICVLVWKKFFS